MSTLCWFCQVVNDNSLFKFGSQRGQYVFPQEMDSKVLCFFFVLLVLAALSYKSEGVLNGGGKCINCGRLRKRLTVSRAIALPLSLFNKRLAHPAHPVFYIKTFTDHSREVTFHRSKIF